MKTLFKLVIAVIIFVAAAILYQIWVQSPVCRDCNIIMVAFAKDAFLFKNAISPALWTVPTYIIYYFVMGFVFPVRAQSSKSVLGV